MKGEIRNPCSSRVLLGVDRTYTLGVEHLEWNAGAAGHKACGNALAQQQDLEMEAQA